MKKVLALILAVAMLATLNVGALAGGGNGFILTAKGRNPNDDDFWPIGKDKITIRVGESVPLELFYLDLDKPDADKNEFYEPYPGKITWRSEDETKVTVSDSGVVTGVGTRGGHNQVLVYAEVYYHSEKIEQYVAINIEGELTVEIEPAELTLNVGQQKIIRAIEKENGVENGDKRIVDWATGDESVVSIKEYLADSSVALLAVSPGTTTITVTCKAWPDILYSASCKVTVVDPNVPKPPVTDPDNPDQPTPPVTDPDNPDPPTPPVTDPDNPDKPTPKPPVVDSGAAPADKTPQATDNPANDDKTTDALRSGDAVELKLTNGSAGLSTDTIDTLGGSKGKLTLQNGGMTVTIPGGFGKVNEPGRIYFPFDYEDAPRCAADMLAAVKGESAKSEARKVGGSMTLPTTVTVTLKTKLTGTVHIYLYNEETGKFTLLASPVAKDGTITLSTRQMGYMLLTTGRV